LISRNVAFDGTLEKSTISYLKFKSHYVQQASVADDPTVTFRLFRLCTLFLKLGPHYPTSLRSSD